MNVSELSIDELASLATRSRQVGDWETVKAVEEEVAKRPKQRLTGEFSVRTAGVRAK